MGGKEEKKERKRDEISIISLNFPRNCVVVFNLTIHDDMIFMDEMTDKWEKKFSENLIWIVKQKVHETVLMLQFTIHHALLFTQHTKKFMKKSACLFEYDLIKY